MKNTIENLIISLLVFIVGVSIGGISVHKADLSTMDKLIKSQERVMLEAVNKQTTKVVNEVHNEIQKLKLKNSTLTNEKSDKIDPTINTNIENPKKRLRLFKK